VSFGVKTLTVYKYSSKIVAVPFELLQDSNVDIEAFVRSTAWSPASAASPTRTSRPAPAPRSRTAS
jgi:hypothetical protein